MGSILVPGYLRWDGFKYVLDPNITHAMSFNSSFYVYFDGFKFIKISV